VTEQVRNHVGFDKMKDTLTEVPNCRQIEGEPLRRWFTCLTMDLIVWFEDEAIIGFQLCYKEGPLEHALAWRSKGGYQHHRIDAGDCTGRPKMTPILVPGGPFRPQAVAPQFECRAVELELPIRKLVLSKLHDLLQ